MTEKKGAECPSLLSCVLSPPFILSPIWCLGKDEKQRNKSSPTLISSVEGLMILSVPLLNLFSLQFLFVLHLSLNSLILLLLLLLYSCSSFSLESHPHPCPCCTRFPMDQILGHRSFPWKMLLGNPVNVAPVTFYHTSDNRLGYT